MVVIKKLTYISLLLLTLSGCFRESNDYPVGVDPFSITESDIPGYFIGTEITETMNYYVPSQNTDAYLLVNKEIISDSLLVKGDFLWFGEVESFVERDTIYISPEYNEATPTYFFGVYRDSMLVDFSSKFPENAFKAFIPVTEESQSELCMITWDDEFIQDFDYNALEPESTFLSLPLTPGEEFGFYYTTAKLREHYSIDYINKNLHVLTKRFNCFLPSDLGFSNAIDIDTSISAPTLQSAQALYNNMLVSSKSLSIDFKTKLPDNMYIVLQYKDLVESEPTHLLLSQNHDLVLLNSSSELWSFNSNTLKLFPNSSGEYLLVNSIPETQSYQVPIDGTYSSIYLGDFYCNLENTVIDNAYLTLNLDSSITDWDSKFGAQSYNLATPNSIYGFSFEIDGELVSELPDDMYIEVGFPESKADRLLFFHKDDGYSLTVDYLTESDSYDEEHYTSSDGFLYFGVNSNSEYFFADYEPNLESKTVHIPYDNVWFDYGNLTIHNNEYTDDLTSIELIFDTEIPYYDRIFAGEPFTLESTPFTLHTIMRDGDLVVQELEDDEFIEIGLSSDLINSTNPHLFTINNTLIDFELYYQTAGDEYNENHYASVDNFIYFGSISSSKYVIADTDTDLDEYTFFLPPSAVEIMTDDFFISTNSVVSAHQVHIDTSPQNNINTSYFNPNLLNIDTPEFVYEANLFIDDVPLESLQDGEVIILSRSHPEPADNMYIFDILESNDSISIVTIEETTDNTKYSYSDGLLHLGIDRSSLKLFASLNKLADQVIIPLAKEQTTIMNPYLSCFCNLNNEIQNTYPVGLLLNASITESIPSEAIDLMNQYDSELVSSVYDFSLTDGNGTNLDTLLAEINPIVDIVSTNQTHLFYFTPDNRGRLYPYPLGTELNGYDYVIGENGAMFLVHDPGYYFAIDENTPLQIADYEITSLTEPVNVSLYQTQFMLPAYFLPHYFQVGNRVQISNNIAIPGYSPIAGYDIAFKDFNDQPITTSFIFDHANEESPLLYLQFPPSYVGSNLRLYFRDLNGAITEYTYVDEFSDNQFYLEFSRYNNSAIVVVNEPGTFFITGF